MRHKNIRRAISDTKAKVDTLFIESGSGYFGSVYRTTLPSPRQWKADGADIVGETGATYTMTGANEGKVITVVRGAEESNPVQMFSPGQLSLALWFDACDTSFMEVIGGTPRVRNWYSRAGSYTLRQDTLANRPYYDITDGVPELSTRTITTINMMLTSLTGLPTGTQSSYLLMLFRGTQIDSNYRFAFWWNRRGIAKMNNNQIGAGISGVSGVNSGVVLSNTEHMAAFKFTSSNYSIRVDGGTETSLNGSHNSPASAGGVFPTGVEQPFLGGVREIIMLFSEPTTSDRQKLEGYLAHKWGKTALLASGHPYKNNPPRIS